MDERALERRLRTIERRLATVVRTGVVEEADYESGLVRVRELDADGAPGALSRWVPWLTRRAGGDVDWWPPEVNEQALLLAPGGLEDAAVCMAALYSEATPAPETTADVHRVNYGNGSKVIHDRAAGTLKLVLTGDLVVEAEGNVQVSAGGDATVAAEGNVEATAGGNVAVEAGGDMSLTASGKVAIQGATVELN